MKRKDPFTKRQPPGPRRFVQRLVSGTIIRQDFRTASRFVFFDTGVEEWQYATHGGTPFVVLYRGRLYGLTCRHVWGTFNWGQLIVTANRFGPPVAGLERIAYASNASGAAISSRLMAFGLAK